MHSLSFIFPPPALCPLRSGQAEQGYCLFRDADHVTLGSMDNRKLADATFASKFNVSNFKRAKRLQLPGFTCITYSAAVPWPSSRPVCAATQPPLFRECRTRPAPRYSGAVFPEAAQRLGHTAPQASICTRLQGTISRGRSFKNNYWNSTGFLQGINLRNPRCQRDNSKRDGRGHFLFLKQSGIYLETFQTSGAVSRLQPNTLYCSLSVEL